MLVNTAGGISVDDHINTITDMIMPLTPTRKEDHDSITNVCTKDVCIATPCIAIACIAIACIAIPSDIAC